MHAFDTELALRRQQFRSVTARLGPFSEHRASQYVVCFSYRQIPAGETGLKDIVKQRAAELERDLMTKALEETNGNVTRAAKLLQISRKSLQTKMKEFGLRETATEPREDEE